MSIAASVVVNPSRRLLMLATALCVCVASIGCAVGLGAVGELPLSTRLLCAFSCAVLACGGLAYTMRRRSIYRLDISGSGQIRLQAVDLNLQETRVLASTQPHAVGMLVTLLADSTLWPHFMLLRLQGEDGRLHTLPILSDCLSAEAFRAISVACRWIAAHRFSELN